LFGYQDETVVIQGKPEGVNVYILMEKKIPETARASVAAYLCKLNMALDLGSFDFDVSDGEVRFRFSFVFTGSPDFLHLMIVSLEVAIRTFKQAKDELNRRAALGSLGALGDLLAELERIKSGGTGGPKPATEAKEDEFPLLVAAREMNIDKVKELIRQGHNVNQQNEEGITALTASAARGQTAIIEVLLNQGARIDHENKNKDTSLSLAVFKGHAASAIYLIKRGANVHHQDKFGDTPLHDAVKNNLKEVVQALLTAGARASTANKEGETPISLALSKGLSDIAQLLVR